MDIIIMSHDNSNNNGSISVIIITKCTMGNN